MISWTFVAAALVVVLVPQWLPARLRVWALAALSIAGVAFVWSAPVVPILGAALAVHALGLALPRLGPRARAVALAAAILAILGVLVWLRAATPARSTLVATTAVLGLSYFSLKFIQHLVDAAAGRAGSVDLAGHLVTIFLLPTFPAGPIERTGDFCRVLAQPAPPWSERVLGIERILLGLAKKLLVGDRLLAFAEPAFAFPELTAPGTLWLSTYAFAIALYLDFAGYSDVAIGVAQCAGLRVRENFDSPFLQRNLNLLWQRWHMSLTGWLRDFIFTPVARRLLRLTHRPFASQAVAQTATMLACGLWHGLAWNFAAWGLYHAFFLTAFAAWRSRRVGLGPAAARSPVRDALATLLTFHVFAVGTILFGCSLRRAVVFLARMSLLDGLLPG